MEIIQENLSFSGLQRTYEHASSSTHTNMRFSAFIPDGAHSAPVVYWLSGLTCTEENFTTKAGAQRMAGELGLVVVAPDTSPRGPNVPDDSEGSYDFGLGAGFYVDATQSPWDTHYQMRQYIESELPSLVAEHLPVDSSRQGILGHSMGGHGALTIGLRNPAQFKSISAFAPIVSPLNCPWGEKALGGYLGADRTQWRAYDACALIEDGARVQDILVDQGSADDFLESQLRPELLVQACEIAGINLTYRLQEGYDHSYYFIASFIEDHLRWHAARLT
ncbi:MAG: S-formylglutathione hydrolase [Pseudomonadota bacterium]